MPRQFTPPLQPPPRGDQDEPFHRATPKADTPPAVAKLPPAYKLSPSNTSAETDPSRPLAGLLPSEDHEVPFQTARPPAATLPALVKLPPAYSRPLCHSRT